MRVCATLPALIIIGALGCSGPDPTTGPQPAGTVLLSVPGMHCEKTCEPRVRTVLQALPFVDPNSVRPWLASRRVAVRPKAGQKFDLEAAKKALQDAGYSDVQVIEPPAQ